jgi:hypothetical protein
MTPAMLCSCVLMGVALTEEVRRLHERILRDAVRLSGGTMLSAAQEAEIDQAQFTRQVQLLEGSHKRLAMQPRAFWQWYAVAIVNALGLPRDVRRAAHLQLAALGRKRMTHMSAAGADVSAHTASVQLPLRRARTGGAR